MEWVKRVLLGLVGLIVLLMVVGLMLPSVVDVTAEKAISASPEAAVKLLSSPRTWLAWSPWNNDLMPQMTSTYEGPDAGVGARWVWKDPEHGDGDLEITQVEPAKSVHYVLRFADFEPMRSEITLSTDAGKTKVSWHATWDVGGTPWWRWMGLMMEGAMADEYLTAIEGLEKAASKGGSADR